MKRSNMEGRANYDDKEEGRMILCAQSRISLLAAAAVGWGRRQEETETEGLLKVMSYQEKTETNCGITKLLTKLPPVSHHSY